MVNVEVRRDSRDSPDQPQRERDPADVSGAEQVTDVVGLPRLRLKLFLWGGRGTTNTVSLDGNPPEGRLTVAHDSRIPVFIVTISSSDHFLGGLAWRRQTTDLVIEVYCIAENISC